MEAAEYAVFLRGLFLRTARKEAERVQWKADDDIDFMPGQGGGDSDDGDDGGGGGGGGGGSGGRGGDGSGGGGGGGGHDGRSARGRAGRTSGEIRSSQQERQERQAERKEGQKQRKAAVMVQSASRGKTQREEFGATKQVRERGASERRVAALRAEAGAVHQMSPDDA